MEPSVATIQIKESDISLAVILFYGVETHAEINGLSQGRGYLKGKYLLYI